MKHLPDLGLHEVSADAEIPESPDGESAMLSPALALGPYHSAVVLLEHFEKRRLRPSCEDLPCKCDISSVFDNDFFN